MFSSNVMPIKVERQYSPPASKYANQILSPVVLEEVPRSAEDGYYMTEYFRLPFGIALIPQKNVVIFLCFLGLFVAYIIRICLSQAMIPMSIHYGWEEAIQGHIFAAFYYGYLITQIPGGWVSQIFGSKYVILCGILGSSVLNTLVPAASSNVRLFIAVRMLTGFVQGVRGSLNLKIVAFVISGQHLGTAVAQGGYPLLATRLGWRVPFYLIGVLGFVWSLFWVYLIKSKPTIPMPSTTSSILICSSPVNDETQGGGNVGDLQEISPIEYSSGMTTKDSLSPWITSGTSSFIIQKPPWYDFFFHLSVWAYFVLFFCYNWSFYLLVAYLPKYLATILGFSAGTSGKITVTAYIGLYASILVGGRLSASLMSKKRYSPTFTRKLGVFIGLLPSILLLPAIGAGIFQDRNSIATVLVISIAATGFAQAAYAPNPMDLFPKSPAIVASIGNSIGTLPGFLSSIMAGWILQKGNCGSASEKIWNDLHVGSPSPFNAPPMCLTAWGLVFGSCAAVYLFGLVIWLLFASGVPIRPAARFGSSHPMRGAMVLQIANSVPLMIKRHNNALRIYRAYPGHKQGQVTWRYYLRKGGQVYHTRYVAIAHEKRDGREQVLMPMDGDTNKSGPMGAFWCCNIRMASGKVLLARDSAWHCVAFHS
ncbi:hypothetical protein DI09_6p350 [Mitosporidium daphniae]|uniref:Major facilitator superfamily (MFS) profile domain-containing protein n=1 Tax=Mitosporidium daphniae TaxID=1485682 RepID=A0A098VRW4_9MICR|nr:uncharacterized protein DI09_6p350 [Mitosporidium daphniae]KGG50451.1 hypothetical protein DI09_6p350 [Mitosporidium daphniae]|eukprot:XP_013236878.1 uncharacterized protein DI09_6p350 [Mitosporidium daphniae]